VNRRNHQPIGAAYVLLQLDDFFLSTSPSFETTLFMSNTHRCARCGDTKPDADFYSYNSRKTNRKRRSGYCRSCYRAWYRDRHSFPLTYFANTLQKRRGVAPDVTAEWLCELLAAQAGCCAISGVPLTFKRGAGRIQTNASLDRIDNIRGYVRGNLQLVCRAVNTMKRAVNDMTAEFTLEELRVWCRRILGRGELEHLDPLTTRYGIESTHSLLPEREAEHH
jgi:hypothetical protein